MIAGIGDDDADGKKAILEVVDLKDLAFLRGVEGLGSDGDLFFGMEVDGGVSSGVFGGGKIGFSK
jgi:hypothetical protein